MCLISLTACGFQLRGTIPLAPPLQNIYLKTSDPYGQLSKNLRQYLKMSGIHLADSPANAKTILAILKEDQTQQLVSVGGTQQTRQYNLILNVTFQVTDPQNNTLVGPQTVSETRTLTLQSNQILAGSNEAENLYQQMRRAIIFDIMNYLSSEQTTNKLQPTPHRTNQLLMPSS